MPNRPPAVAAGSPRATLGAPPSPIPSPAGAAAAAGGAHGLGRGDVLGPEFAAIVIAAPRGEKLVS